MNTSAFTREEAVVRQLRSKFERDGYRYFEYPSPDLLPSFLGSYRPDAIAIGPDRNVAIEVKAQRPPSVEEPLARIARLFEGHPEWEFRVVMAARSDEDQEYSFPNGRQLSEALEEAVSLSREGRHRPALVLGWSVIEAYARARGLAGLSTPAGAREIVQWLTSEGLLTQHASTMLRSLVPLRNAVVHGDFALAIDGGRVSAFLEEARKLVDEHVLAST